MQKTVVTAPGSLGDVNPMLSIARALQKAGHDILFMAAERYLPLAQRAGLQTRPLVSEADFARLLANPNVWHPREGVRVIFRDAVADFLEPQYRWLEENCDPQQTLLVSHALDFAGRIYRDRHPACRMISAIPAPAILRSATAPPRLSGFWWEPYIPHQLFPLIYRAADKVIDHYAAKQINALRLKIGLPAVSRLLHQWWWSPDLTLCMFPSWYSIPERDLLPRMELTGFPLEDSADVVSSEEKDRLAKTLAHFGDKRPVVFAPGTAHAHAADYLHVAARTCRELGRPGILISSDSTQFPKELPSYIVTANYLPFSQLLPHASAIVHHGGVGTTSQALRAGVPQLILAMAFDQFDNGQRVQQLGCGSWFPMRKLTQKRLTERLIGLTQTASACSQVAAKFEAEPSFTKRVVDLVLGSNST